MHRKEKKKNKQKILVNMKSLLKVLMLFNVFLCESFMFMCVYIFSLVLIFLILKESKIFRKSIAIIDLEPLAIFQNFSNNINHVWIPNKVIDL